MALLHPSDSSPRLEPVKGPDLIRNLWIVSFNLPTPADRARCFHAVGKLAARAMSWNLYRRLSVEDLPATVDHLAQAVQELPDRPVAT